MTVLTIPPEVAAECSRKLLDLAASASRDATTLTKQAIILARNEMPARALATLRKYVKDYDQYKSSEVAKIVAAIVTAADPAHVQRLARNITKNDATRAEAARDCAAATERAWKPGGKSWNSAIESAEKNSRVLSLAAKRMRTGEANRHLVNAMRALDENHRVFWRIERYLPYDQQRAIHGDAESQEMEGFFVEPPQKAPRHSPNGNVISGPWDAGGEARS